jgi:hypothetical protein
LPRSRCPELLSFDAFEGRGRISVGIALEQPANIIDQH